MIDRATMQGRAEELYGNMPHPQGNGQIKVNEWPAYVRVAARLKGARMPQADDVISAYTMLKGAGVSPAEFEYVWDKAKPVSTRLIGQEPHILEIARLAQAHPSEILNYYSSMPHPKHPEISAGDYAKYFHAMQGHAQEHQQRDPNGVEIVRAAMGNWETEDIINHYQQGSKKVTR
jgi:hypothetical protein